MRSVLASCGLMAMVVLTGCSALIPNMRQPAPVDEMTAAQAQAGENYGFIEFDLSRMNTVPVDLHPSISYNLMGGADSQSRGPSWFSMSLTGVYRDGNKVTFYLPKIANYELSTVGIWPTSTDGKIRGEARVILENPNDKSHSSPLPKLTENNKPLEIQAMGRDDKAPGIAATPHLKEGQWLFYGVFVESSGGGGHTY